MCTLAVPSTQAPGRARRSALKIRASAAPRGAPRQVGLLREVRDRQIARPHRRGPASARPPARRRASLSASVIARCSRSTVLPVAPPSRPCRTGRSSGTAVTSPIIRLRRPLPAASQHGRVEDEVLVCEVGEQLRGGPQLREAVAALLEGADVAVGQPLRGELRRVALEHRAHVVELLELRLVVALDRRAAVRLRLDQPLALEQQQRLADRRAARAELLAPAPAPGAAGRASAGRRGSPLGCCGRARRWSVRRRCARTARTYSSTRKHKELGEGFVSQDAESGVWALVAFTSTIACGMQPRRTL